MSRRRAAHFWVLLIGLLFTAGVTLLYHRASVAGDEAAFGNAVEAAHDRIAGRLELYVALLLGARGLLGAHPAVEPEGFRRYVAALELDDRFPGALGIGFSLAVPAEGRHEIVFLEPLDRRNRAAIGYDMSTDPVRREAMERARDTGLPAASQVVTLVQEIDAAKQPGFLLYVPVYRRAVSTVAERRAELVGYVYSPFRTGDLFAGIFGLERQPRVAFDVYQGETRLYISPRPTHAARFSRVMSLDVGGVMWGVRYESRAALDELSGRVFEPWLIGVGVAFSLLLFALTRGQLRARAEAEAQRQNLHAIFEQAPAAMAIVDARDLTYTLSNPQNIAMSGGRARPGRRVDDALPELEAQGMLALLRGVMAGSEPVVVNEVALRLQDGAGERLVYMNGTYQPMRGASGHIEGVMAFGYEVTDLVRARQARDDFLSVAGHELRTPLTALALQLDSLVRQVERGKLGVTPPAVLERIVKARATVERLDRLVGQLLDVARIGGGRLALHLEEVDLAEVVREVAERVAIEAHAAGSELRVVAPGPTTGRWDRLRVEQIVLNLMSNAVKYGGGAAIDVTVDADGERARAAVRDRGIGVAPADRERIFGRFERAVSDRSYGGLGLGLWISRELATAMGGTVSVADADGGGSEFTVELPRGATPG